MIVLRDRPVISSNDSAAALRRSGDAPQAARRIAHALAEMAAARDDGHAARRRQRNAATHDPHAIQPVPVNYAVTRLAN